MKQCHECHYVIMNVTRYALPSVALVNRYSLESRPHHLAVNCNTTLLSIIDVTGLLQFVDLGELSTVVKLKQPSVNFYSVFILISNKNIIFCRWHSGW